MRRRPPTIVAIQLKIFTPVGIAMSMLVAEKIAFSVSPRPTANMWCAHTPNDRNAMATLDPATNAYPKMGFRLKTGMTSEIIPIAGSTMM